MHAQMRRYGMHMHAQTRRYTGMLLEYGGMHLKHVLRKYYVRMQKKDDDNLNPTQAHACVCSSQKKTVICTQRHPATPSALDVRANASSYDRERQGLRAQTTRQILVHIATTAAKGFGISHVLCITFSTV